jgi:hypothetical protein
MERWGHARPYRLTPKSCPTRAGRLKSATPRAMSSRQSNGTDNPYQDSQWNTCPCCGGRRSSSRSSNPAASRGSGPSHRSGSTVHDHHTPLAIPHHRFRATLLSHRHRPRSADSDRQRRLRPANPAASNTRSPGRSRPGRAKPTPRWSLNRRPVRNRQIRSTRAGKFPIGRHQRRCELPLRFPPSRLFGPLPPCAPHASEWQASENP